MSKRLLESFSSEPLGAVSLLATLLSFLVPTGMTIWKDWDSGKPKINVFCKDLGQSPAFFQARSSNKANRGNWSSPVDSKKAIDGYLAALPDCEVYNLQNSTISIRNITNTMYFDRSETNELPDFLQFFDPINDERFKEVPTKFPVVIAPGSGIKFKGVVLFPVADISVAATESCKALSSSTGVLANFSRCISEIHGKPLVNLLLEGQQIGFGSINSVGIKIVLADNTQINYIPTVRGLPFKENKEFSKLRTDVIGLSASRGEMWLSYPDDREYVQIGNQYILWSMWSLGFFALMSITTIFVAYLTILGLFSIWKRQRGVKVSKQEVEP